MRTRDRDKIVSQSLYTALYKTRWACVLKADNNWIFFDILRSLLYYFTVDLVRMF